MKNQEKAAERMAPASGRIYCRGWMVALVLGALLWMCYSNSFNASWQYDDEGNILTNTQVHMTQWSWTQLKQALTAGHDFQTISRPLAYLSFALNHRLGGLNPFGYHVVNFVIHWISAVLVFLLIRDMLNLPLLAGRYVKQACLIAFIAALLWATHPIQVTAVTYIVQRMASMAAMFYVAAMYLYLKARTSPRRRVRTLSLILCAISGLLALLTKENSLLLFYSLLLFELILLQGVGKRSVRQAVIWGVGLTMGMILIGSLYTDLGTFFKPYGIRPFSMFERVLTQPRVIFFYLGLIAVPMTSRLALLHDIEISQALFTPWTTSVAVAALAASILVLLAVSRRYPLFSFCGLFFFLNHAVEGSVLNLELIYEHRNYLPTMLLFVPIAVGAVRCFEHFRYRRDFQWLIAATLILFVCSQGYITHAYNRIHESELSLWLHTTRRSPRLSLAHSNLGNIYWGMGLRDRALEQFSVAHALDRFNNALQRGHLLYNLGLHDAYEKKAYGKALERYSEAIEIYNGSPKIWYEIVRTHTILEQYGEAQRRIDSALAHWPERSDFHYLQSVIHAKMGMCRQALDAANVALEKDPGNTRALMIVAGSLKCLGEVGQAIETWEQFLEMEDKSLLGVLSIIELFVATGEGEKAYAYYERLHQMSGDREMESMLDLVGENGLLIPYPPDRRLLEDLFSQWQK